MSETHGHAISTTHTPGGDFTPAEVESLHKEDVHAARAVVSLIFGILMIGVALYSFVLWTVST